MLEFTMTLIHRMSWRDDSPSIRSVSSAVNVDSFHQSSGTMRDAVETVTLDTGCTDFNSLVRPVSDGDKPP